MDYKCLFRYYYHASLIALCAHTCYMAVDRRKGVSRSVELTCRLHVCGTCGKVIELRKLIEAIPKQSISSARLASAYDKKAQNLYCSSAPKWFYLHQRCGLHYTCVQQ